MRVDVRYWAAIRAAAGVKEESVELEDASTVSGLVALLIANHGSRDFARILDGCSVLIDGRSVGRAARPATVIAAGQTVEFLPPFAGG